MPLLGLRILSHSGRQLISRTAKMALPWVISLLLAASTLHGPSTAPVRLKQSVPPELANAVQSITRLGKYYASLSCVYDHTWVTNKGTDNEHARKYTIKQHRANVIIAEELTGKDKHPRTRLLGKNSRYYFVIEKRGDQPFVLVDVRPASEADAKFRARFKPPGFFLESPAAIGDTTLAGLLDALDSSRLTLSAPAGWRKNDNQFDLEIEIRDAPEAVPTNVVPFKAAITLQKRINGDWVIRAGDVTYSKRGAEPFGYTFTISIDECDGVPVPSTVIRNQRGMYNGSRTTAVSESRTKLVKLGGLSDTDFTLSAFGLPEPFGIEWEKPIPWGLYIIGGTLGMVVLMGVIWRIRRWRSAA